MSFLTGNEFGFSDIATDFILEGIKKIPSEWLSLTEDELKEVCYPHETRAQKISSTNKLKIDDKLRAAFWIEYNSAVDQKRKMINKKIYHGIVHEGTFNNIAREAERIAWIIHPPGSYNADIQSLLSVTTRRYAEILSLPIMENVCRCNWECTCDLTQTPTCFCKSEKGCICPPKINTKVADAIIKVGAQVELRTQGSIPQYINQKTLNVNVNKNQEITASTEEATIVSTREELLALRQQHEALLSGTRQPQLQKEVIEVENVGDNKDGD